MTDIQLPAEGETQVHIFKKCLPLQIQLEEIVSALGATGAQTCLDVGSRNGMLSHHLRKRGGKWHSAALTEQEAHALRRVVKDNVVEVSKGALPFKKCTFDAVVAVGALERFEGDSDFIEECHRVLKPDGRLVVDVARSSPASGVGILRKLLGVTPERRGLVRDGYTESELFTILKDGFDVHQMRSHTRFFTAITDTVVTRLTAAHGPGRPKAESRVRRTFSIAGPLYRLGFQFDMLLFLSRGYHLIASAKRRAWRPRKTPILIDGRSISEAVLSRPLM